MLIFKTVARSSIRYGSPIATGLERAIKRRWALACAIPLVIVTVGALAAKGPSGIRLVEVEEVPNTLASLRNVKPLEPDLSEYIVDKLAAQQLGKALFWDVQVGSQGIACAICHFHAGADIRTRNQVSPGIKSGDMAFSSRSPATGRTGPDRELEASDFPFRRLADVGDRESVAAFDSNDVFSSQGSLGGSFISVMRPTPVTGAGHARPSPSKGPARMKANELCSLVYDPANNPFHADNLIYRKVEPRQTPTIRAITGYPMCIPRLDPATGGDDPLCPQRNRPLASGGCRNFAAAGWRLPSGQDLPAPAAGQVYCSSFVMGDPLLARPQEPISTAQAPFEIGDYVTFSGTLLQGDGAGPQGTDTISVHTLTANVGIYTEPGTLPVYVAIGEFGGSPGAPRNFNGVPQEAADRLVLDAFVTDVTSIADVYFVDIDPVTGAESQRWLTPGSMTGGFGSIADDGSYVDGGITTQFTGPVPGRVRIRANLAAQGILSSPSRYMRVVVRQLCDPTTITGLVARIDGAGGRVPCLQRATVANGLMSGQYMAPVSSYIFPENVVPGDAPVANDLWGLGFLMVGEGPGTGGLKPQPWLSPFTGP